MDQILHNSLDRWHKQIQTLKEVEENCYQLDASEKPLFAQLFLKTEGANVKERESKVYASNEWTNFSKALSTLKSNLNHERRLLALKQKAYDAEHITYKIENEGVKRSGHA